MIELINVSKRYKECEEDVLALDNINISIPDKGLVVINGTSGCGKTTLLNILSGLDAPTSGEVRFDGERIDNQNEEWWDEFRSTNMGFVYQDYNLLENMTVRENLMLPLELQNLESNERDKRIEEITKELGLGEYLDKYAKKLSGGQKQRVAIARALITGKRIIFADEPTGNLDKENSENVFSVLQRIAKKRLVIVVTHDYMLANEYAERLVQLAYGKIDSDVLMKTVSDKNDTMEAAGKNNVQEEVTNSKARLSTGYSIRFAKQIMGQRKLRCTISIMIFAITMVFILVACSLLFRRDSVPLSEHIAKDGQNVLGIVVDVDDEYSKIAPSTRVSTGKNLYELLCKCIGKERVIRLGGTKVLYYGDTGTRASSVYVEEFNKEYFEYEGIFPEKENEIAISSFVAKNLSIKDKVIGSSIMIDKNEYIVTAVITKVCGKSIEQSYLDDGMGVMRMADLVVLPLSGIWKLESSSYVDMPGYGVNWTNSLLYQVTVFEDVVPIDEDTILETGRMPQADNEILIAKHRLEYRGVDVKDIVGKTCRLKDIYSDEYGRAFWNLINLSDYSGEKFTIVGVAGNVGRGDYYVRPELYNKLYTDYTLYYSGDYYALVNEDELESIIYNLNKQDLRISNAELRNVYEFANDMEDAAVLIFIVISVVSLLAMLQMISLYSYGINDNKKTIGILRTIGVNKKDTMRIFTFECIVVTAISFVVALIASVFVIVGVNEFINMETLLIPDFNIIRIRFGIVFVAGAINLLLSVLSVMIPLKKYSKKKVIDLIK